MFRAKRSCLFHDKYRNVSSPIDGATKTKRLRPWQLSTAHPVKRIVKHSRTPSNNDDQGEACFMHS